MRIATFINRPVLSCVLSVFVVILVVIGLLRLPMEQFPEIAPPTVRVLATYTGANVETLQRSVIAPLEEAINGVEGINYMTSSANNNGQATVQIYFRQGTDPDMVAVNVHPDSNANEVVARIDEVISHVSEDLPDGLVLAELMSVKSFMDASIFHIYSPRTK